MQVGDEVEVYHVSAREPWRTEFLSMGEDANGDYVVMVKRCGEPMALYAGGAVGPHGYYLAPKHVAKLQEMRRAG